MWTKLLIITNFWIYAIATSKSLVIGSLSYSRDYAEIFNLGEANVDLSFFKLQIAPGDSSERFFNTYNLPNIELQPGQSYLYESNSIDIFPASGKVRIALESAMNNDWSNRTNIFDLVGYNGANFFEGNKSISFGGVDIIERVNRCLDTDKNDENFEVRKFRIPRSLNSPLVNCFVSYYESYNSSTTTEDYNSTTTDTDSTTTTSSSTATSVTSVTSATSAATATTATTTTAAVATTTATTTTAAATSSTTYSTEESSQGEDSSGIIIAVVVVVLVVAIGVIVGGIFIYRRKKSSQPDLLDLETKNKASPTTD